MPDQRAPDEHIVAFAPGRVNLIGEHTDYTDGLAVPMAVDLGTTITGMRRPGRIAVESAGFEGALHLEVDAEGAPTIEVGEVEPAWGRYLAAVASVMRTGLGFEGQISTTIPVGTGLSSSAALEVAFALAIDAQGDAIDVARRCREAELLASGVPCGLMDQLTALAGVDGHALLIDFRTLVVEPVPVPPDIAVVVVHSGQERALATSAYAERRAELEAAERAVGSLRDATIADLGAIDDPRVRARARHVITENERVTEFADALRLHDGRRAGALMVDSHRSFRDDFAASTSVVDALVDRLVATPGVHGARLTGGGFGGCAVALVDPGAATESWGRHWVVRPSAGAGLRRSEAPVR